MNPQVKPTIEKSWMRQKTSHGNPMLARFDCYARPGTLVPNFKTRAKREVYRCIIYMTLYGIPTAPSQQGTSPGAFRNPSLFPTSCTTRKTCSMLISDMAPSVNLSAMKDIAFFLQLTAKSIRNHLHVRRLPSPHYAKRDQTCDR